jgi:hypothetical protein
LNCSVSAFLCPKSRKTFPLPRTTSKFSLLIATSPSAFSNGPLSDRSHVWES